MKQRDVVVALALLALAACSSSSLPASPVADAGPTDAASLDAGPTDPGSLQPPPASGGVQMKTDAFDVPAGDEIQNCYFFKVSDLETAAGLPATAPIDVHRVEIVQTPGSHHMNVFRVRTIVGLDPANAVNGVITGMNGQGPCFASSNWADWPLVANTQQAGDQDWSYPDGVANEIDSTEVLMVQTHYVNATTQMTPGGGQVAVNLWTIPASTVTAQIGTVFATNQNIRVCMSNPTPTYTATCQISSPTPVTIVGANGHFHSRGKEFDMYTWDGKSTTTPPDSDRFYQSTTWDEPPMLHSPGLEQPVSANGGIWYSCSYVWQAPPDSIGCATLNAIDAKKYKTPAAQQDCCYTFGPIVEENEHCNAFVYYYPKQDNVTCE